MIIFDYNAGLDSIDLFMSKAICYKDNYVVDIAMVLYISGRNPRKIPRLSISYMNPFLAAKGKTSKYETFGEHKNYHCIHNANKSSIQRHFQNSKLINNFPRCSRL